MSHFDNPFTNLVRREYNVTNLKKILDTFPTSLEVKQLTSNQLLERLRALLQDKDITIEELRAQLLDRGRTGEELNSINEQLNSLADGLSLGDDIENSIQDVVDQSIVNSLEQQGYVQIPNTQLYVNVNERVLADAPFHLDHTREKNEPFPPSDLKSPNSVSFINLSENNDVWIKKKELWTRDQDGFAEPNRFSGGANFAPTNVFKFIQFPNLHETAVKIPKGGEEVISDIGIFYRTREQLKSAGLKRSGETNTWEGFLLLKAKVGNSTNIDDVSGFSIGKMILFRDRT